MVSVISMHPEVIMSIELHSFASSRRNNRGRCVNGEFSGRLANKFIDPDVRGNTINCSFTGNETWDTFDGIFQLLLSVITTLFQIALAFKLIRRHVNAPVFLLLCLIQPLVSLATEDRLYGRSEC